MNSTESPTTKEDIRFWEGFKAGMIFCALMIGGIQAIVEIIRNAG